MNDVLKKLQVIPGIGKSLARDLIDLGFREVKELRRQELAPKGMERSNVRRLLREVQLREDVRANAIFTMFLYIIFHFDYLLIRNRTNPI